MSVTGFQFSGRVSLKQTDESQVHHNHELSAQYHVGLHRDNYRDVSYALQAYITFDTWAVALSHQAG